MRNNKFKWLAVIFITAWAIYSFYPPQGRNQIDVFNEMASMVRSGLTPYQVYVTGSRGAGAASSQLLSAAEPGAMRIEGFDEPVDPCQLQR